MTMTYDVGNSDLGLGQAQTRDRVKPLTVFSVVVSTII